MQNHEHDRHESSRRGSPSTRNQPRIVDLEAAPSGDTPIHNIAVDLEGAPQWRLWVMVAILGAGTSLALLAA